MAEATDSLSFLCWGGLPLLIILMWKIAWLSRAQFIDRDPGRAPLFYRDLRDVGFFFKDFIYLFERERETVSKKGKSSRGVGEEEAGSQQRSPMRDSFPECWDHALSRRQALNDCATQVLRVVGFLIFQPALWGRDLPRQYSGNPV